MYSIFSDASLTATLLQLRELRPHRRLRLHLAGAASLWLSASALAFKAQAAAALATVTEFYQLFE